MPSRKAVGHLVACCLAALLLQGMLAKVEAGQATTFDYEVRRDGQVIGYNRVVARPIDAGTGLQITFDSELAVKFAFVTVYSFSHHRRELWRNGKMIQAVGRTDNDGDNQVFEIVAEADGYVRTINGHREALAPERLPLTFWNLKTLKGHHAFFSVSDDRLIDVTIDFRGLTDAPWWHGEGPLAHYVISGDEEREIWFDRENRLVRATFDSRGAEIEFRLSEASLAAAP